MEDLNKQQLILLALLVSFVTSIATGIATASLVEQAPPKVTRVINRVVERTVETVSQTENNQGAAVITTEETIVVREDELITASIESATKSLVRIYDSNDSALGVGFVVDKSGIVISSSRVVSSGEAVYTVKLSDGTQAEGRVVRRNAATGIALVQLSGAKDGSVVPLTLGTTEALKLGSSVLAVSGINSVQAQTGIVSELGMRAENGENIVTRVRANLPADVLIPGTALINLFGEVVGVLIESGSQTFIPVEDIEITLETL